MSKRIRTLIAIVILVVSLTLLAWGLWPSVRETRIQRIQPTEMQLPTPSSLLFTPWPIS